MASIAELTAQVVALTTEVQGLTGRLAIAEQAVQQTGAASVRDEPAGRPHAVALVDPADPGDPSTLRRNLVGYGLPETVELHYLQQVPACSSDGKAGRNGELTPLRAAS